MRRAPGVCQAGAHGWRPSSSHTPVLLILRDRGRQGQRGQRVPSPTISLEKENVLLPLSQLCSDC